MPCDAVLMPEAMKQGATQRQRIDSICAITDPLLGVDEAAGERSQIRVQPGAWLFVTRDAADTLRFPTGHPRAGQERYRWVMRSDGIKLGYLQP